MGLAQFSAGVLGALQSPTRQTQTAGTNIVAGIPPFQGNGVPLASGTKATGRIHVTKVCYTTAATAHILFLMRPLNYTTIAATGAAGQQVIAITANPGTYTTNYQYQSPAPLTVANHGIAASDIIMYQAADGTWVTDTVSSVATLNITMTTNLPTGGVIAGGLFYYFGVQTLADPATGVVNPSTQIALSQTRDTTWSDPDAGIISTLHNGDPLVFLTTNPTNAGTLEFITGYYSQI